jgi:integrase
MSGIKERYFKGTLRKAGLRQIRFHDLRHTFASLHLARREAITYVSRQLGHSSPQITLRVYSHWIPREDQREAANKLPTIHGMPQPESATIQAQPELRR